ncbi:hypothetical protein BT93_K0777 [Corymbia citriodora subsp. variegata]|nr:hypothetical protein BT93_K0777 [Corymbia citriodora subsp. variegata]
MYLGEHIQSTSALKIAWCKRITYKMHAHQITSPRE